jgi:hypothetical protein
MILNVVVNPAMVALALGGAIILLVASLANEDSKVVQKILALIILLVLLVFFFLLYVNSRVEHIYRDYSERIEYVQDRMDDLEERPTPVSD